MLIFRTSWLKNPPPEQPPHFGVHLLDPPLAARLGLLTGAGVKRPRCLLQKLLLPGVNLVRVYFVALRQIGHAHLLSQRFQGDLRLQRRIDLPSRLLRHHPLRLTNGMTRFQLIPWSQIRGPLQSRLSAADWERLKAELTARHIRVVALDLPTSWMMAAKAGDEFTSRMFEAIN